MACPSCGHRFSPLAVECPVCGMPISRPPLKRPLLFQVGREATGAFRGLEDQSRPNGGPALPDLGAGPIIGPAGITAQAKQGEGLAKTDAPDFGKNIFWLLAAMELREAAALSVINGLVATIACWQLGLPPGKSYPVFWPYLGALHAIVSWTYFMIPTVLTGSTPAMLALGLRITDQQTEKRLSFSVFMLLSVALLPLSFLCMVLTPTHTTLAELLTGQEIRERGSGTMRGYW